MNMPTLNETLKLSLALHEGQTDKSGQPYWQHPVRVLASLPPNCGEAAQHAALLHDTVEDGHETLDGLLLRGYTQEVVDLVRWLTKPEMISYRDWMTEIRRQAPIDARIVKIADVEDNLSRIDNLPEAERESLGRRYREALEILTAEDWVV